MTFYVIEANISSLIINALQIFSVNGNYWQLNDSK